MLESDSLRVEAETRSRSQALTVFDVVYVPPSYVHTSTYDHETELDTLNEEKAELEARVAALTGQKTILEGYSGSLQAGRIRDVTTEELETFMDAYAVRQVKIHEGKARLQKDIYSVTSKIEEIRKKSLSEEEEKRSAGVTVIILAEEDGSIDVMLSYGSCLPCLIVNK